MRYGDPIAFRQALEQRLKDQANGNGARLARMRKRVAFDCLLARLANVAPGQWLLKGGFALDLRMPTRARSTKDVDIEWRAAESELLDTLIDAAAHDQGDFFVLAIEKSNAPERRFGESHRFKVSTSLAGRPFEAFVLDVGRRENREIKSETLLTDDLLTFAGIAPVEVEAVTLETQIAEKFHALTRTYEGDRVSTRTKDLVDIALVSALFDLDAETLRREIREVFMARRSHLAPNAVPPPPPSWTEPYRRLSEEVGLPNKLSQGHQRAAALLNPILSGEISAGSWNCDDERWQASR